MVEQDFKDYAPVLDSIKVTKAECDAVKLKKFTKNFY